jgi:hypothetical protein
MKRALITTLLLFVLSSFSFGQGLGLNSITGKVGVIMPESPWDTGFLIGAEANLGEIADGITLHPIVSYWSAGYSQSFTGTNFDLSMSNFQIGADVHYQIANVKGLFVGGGLGFNFLSFEFPSYTLFGSTGSTASTSDTKIGFAGVAGYAFPVAGMNGVVSGRYNIIDGFDTLELTFGIEFDMSK